jgi:hypothetical protein
VDVEDITDMFAASFTSAATTTGTRVNSTTNYTREAFLSSPESEGYNPAVEDFRPVEYPQLNSTFLHFLHLSPSHSLS